MEQDLHIRLNPTYNQPYSQVRFVFRTIPSLSKVAMRWDFTWSSIAALGTENIGHKFGGMVPIAFSPLSSMSQ